MTLPNPVCPHCGASAGIMVSAGPHQAVSIYCAGCDLTTLLRLEEPRCLECGADQRNHVAGCLAEAAWSV